MTSREKIKITLNHQTPPTVAVDFGAAPVTGIHISIVEKLRDVFGLEKHLIKVSEPYQMLGEVEGDLLKHLGGDVIGVSPSSNMFGIKNENWKEFITPWKQVVLIPENFNTTTDEDGGVYIYPEGDTTVEPSAKMPATSFFFDALIRQESIDETKLNPEENLEEFVEITDEEIQYFKKEIDKAYSTGKAVMANFGGTGLGDIALVPGLNLKHPKGIRDVSEWYMSTMTRPDYIQEVFDKQTDIAIKSFERISKVILDKVDIVYLCGTDFGTQNGTFCDVSTYELLYMPYYKKINDWIHENTPWKTFKHSCGAVKTFIPDFIKSGFDILNPVQCQAAGMEANGLKNEFGDDIVFWGGGINTQETLPFGTPEEVYKEVSERLKIFSVGGGFVFNSIHNIQAQTPIKNIEAMLKAIADFS